MPKCWVSILYDWGDSGLILASTDAPDVLATVKARVLEEARDTLYLSRDMDEVKAILDDAELVRLQKVFEVLIPEEHNLRTPEAGRHGPPVWKGDGPAAQV